MYAALAGLILGAIIAIASLFLVQRAKVAELAQISGQIDYHFDTCVFGGDDFPNGDLDNGRLLRRGLVPVRASIRYFDSAFNEVTKAAKPGRYGAVVRIDAGGATAYRFITLYRTPNWVRGDFPVIPSSAQFSPEFGVDPTVVQAQRETIDSSVQNILIDYEMGTSPESVAILLAALHEASPTDPPLYLHAGPKTRNDAWWYQLQTKLGLAQQYQFLVDLPRGYDDDASKRWPLILFLHHADAGGSNINDVRTCALAGLIAKGKQVPAIVVSPQCPEAQSWSVPVLRNLLEQMEAKYRVDLDHVYLTGVSAGGDITWDWALIEPDRFAAIVPMSGESDPRDGARLRNLPIWAFQGGKDHIVLPQLAVEMVDGVRKAGGHAHLTIYPDAGHDCWDAAYSDGVLWTWLFAQKRGQAEVVTPGTPSP